MESSVHGRWLGPTLAGTGVLLAAVGAVETWVRVFGSYPVTVPFVAGLVTNLPFVVLLVGGGYRLRRGDLSVERYPRIAGWTVAGTAFFGGFLLLVAWFFFDGWWNFVGVVRWARSSVSAAGS